MCKSNTIDKILIFLTIIFASPSACASNEIKPLNISNSIMVFDVTETRHIDRDSIRTVHAMLSQKISSYVKLHPDQKYMAPNVMAEALRPLVNSEEHYTVILGLNNENFRYEIVDPSSYNVNVLYDSSKDETVSRRANGEKTAFATATPMVKTTSGLWSEDMIPIPVFPEYPKAFEKYQSSASSIPTSSSDKLGAQFVNVLLHTLNGKVNRLDFQNHVGTWSYSDQRVRVEDASIPQTSTFAMIYNFFLPPSKPFRCGTTTYTFYLKDAKQDSKEYVSNNFIQDGDSINGKYIYRKKLGPLDMQLALKEKTALGHKQVATGYVVIGSLCLASGAALLLYFRRKYRLHP